MATDTQKKRALGPNMRRLVITLSATITSNRASGSAPKSSAEPELFQHFTEIFSRITEPGSLQADLNEAFDKALVLVDICRNAKGAQAFFKSLDEETIAAHVIDTLERKRAAQKQQLLDAMKKKKVKG